MIIDYRNVLFKPRIDFLINSNSQCVILDTFCPETGRKLE